MANITEDHLRFFFENSLEALLLTAPEGQILAANPAACTLFGFTEAEILQLGRNGLIDPSDPRLPELLLQRSNTGKIRGELNFKRKDGSIFPCEISSALFKDSSGRTLTSMIVRDITHTAKIKLLQNNEKLANEILHILNSSSDSEPMIRNIISVIRKWTGFEAVAIRIKNGEDFPYFSTSGFDEEFVKAERNLCTYKRDGSILHNTDGSPVLDCMCGNILSGRIDASKFYFTTGGSFQSNNTPELLNEHIDYNMLGTVRGRCFSKGYKSVALIPIHSGSEVIGLLQLNDHREGIFNEEIIPFFESIVSSIGIALKRNKAEQSLKLSEEKYRSIFENVKEVFYQVDMNGNIIEISPSIKYISDFSREDLIGTPVVNLYSNAGDRDALIHQLFENGELNNYEIKLKTRTGEVRYVSLNTRLVYQNNQPHHIDGALHDVTARRKAEEKLMESEERFRTLFEHSLSIMILIDPDTGAIVDANNAAQHFYGWSREELTRMRIQQINTLGEDIGDDLKKVRNQKQVHFEFKHRRADGSIRDVDIYSSKIDILGNAFVHSIIHDITDRKQAEKQLMLLNRAVEQSPVSVMITNKQGELVYVNPTFTEVTGYSASEVLGKNPRFLQSGKHPKKFYEEMWEVILAGNTWRGEFHNKKKSGDSFWEKSVISSIVNSKGEIAFFIAVQEDITRMKKLTHELITAKDKAEESDQLKTAFLHNISHEVRTPINAIVGFSEFLNNKELTPEKQAKFVKIIIDSSNHLLNIINDIINMASIEAGQEHIIEKQVNINSILDRLYQQYWFKANEKPIVIDFFASLNNEEATILTDDNKLYQIYSNLVSNAIKFTKEGFVKVGYAVKENFIEFYVKDSGIGIPQHLHKKIFQRFRQADNSHTRVYGGSGLGLAIAKAYTELLGGKIWLNSVPQKGSEFYFTIPFKTTHVGKKENKVDETAIHINKRKAVLVVEDEDYNFLLLEEIFDKMNIEVVRAFDGQQAIDICYSGQAFDLILMDLKLPGINGYEATKIIRKVLPDIPIVAQTAYSAKSDMQRALEAGCTDFLSKPFDKNQLLQKIRIFLEN